MMKDVERLTLTKRDKDDNVYINEDALSQIVIRKLADYEDAEEQGKLFKFPVAIGDHFWVTEFDNSNIREEWEVICLEAGSDGELYVDGWNDEYHTDIHVNINRFGVDAFAEEKERHV